MKENIIDNIEDLANNRPPSPGQGGFNLIDTNSLINKINSLANNYENLDINTQMLILSILLLAAVLYFTVYIFIFVVSPLIFDIIKNHLPLRLREFIIRYMNFNRKISIPFIILGFIVIVVCVLVVILALVVIVYFRTLR
jgi:hypothetical protein